MVFIIFYIMSFLMVNSGDDWFLVWLGLEINMMTFIILIYRRYNMICIESCLKYFFIQSLGSAMLLGCLYMNDQMIVYSMMMILSYKVGAGPFFFWFPSLCSGINWLSCFMLMSLQKVIPLMLMNLFVSGMMWFIILTSLLFGSFGALNQNNLKRLMAYSSVHHLGWIMLCGFVSDMVWLMYMFMYSIMILVVIYILSYNNVDDFMMIMKWKNKVWFVLSMMGMAGMPPFLGFFLKWYAFYNIIGMDSLVFVMLVLMSVLMFYIYFRIVYDVLMSYCFKDSWLNFIKMKMYGSDYDMFSMMGTIMGCFLGMMIVL